MSTPAPIQLTDDAIDAIIDALLELRYGLPQRRETAIAIYPVARHAAQSHDYQPAPTLTKIVPGPVISSRRVGGRGTGRPAKSRTEPKRKAARVAAAVESTAAVKSTA